MKGVLLRTGKGSSRQTEGRPCARITSPQKRCGLPRGPSFGASPFGVTCPLGSFLTSAVRPSFSPEPRVGQGRRERQALAHGGHVCPFPEIGEDTGLGVSDYEYLVKR